jgi:hypothetical protein
MLEKKLQEELNRYNAINKYGKTMIMEQDALPTDVPPAPDAVAPTDVPPPPPAGDVDTDLPPTPDMSMDTPLSPEMDSTEEIDITDLVDMTKSIKKDLENKQQDHGTIVNKMDDVFTKLGDLEQKLAQMDQVMAKIDQLGIEVQQIKPETPVEKLEMRSLDSYPFNQKPTDFFSQKQEEMRASGKNEYVLTKDDVNDFTPETLRDTFNDTGEEENEFKF